MFETGQLSQINNVPHVGQWQFNRSANTSKYADSSTGKGTAVTKGNINITGSIAGIGGNPILVPGTEHAFVGISDVAPSALSYSGTILITSLQVTVDRESAAIIEWTAGFGAQGDLTAGATAPVDETDFAVHDGASDSAGVAIVGSPDYSIPGFKKWVLNLTCPEKVYTLNKFIHRKPGNLEGTISIDVWNKTVRDVKYDPNTIGAVKLYIDATQFWLLNWVRFKETTNLVVDKRTQAIQGYTINGDWTAQDGVGSALGAIVRPDDAYIFGE